MKKIVTYILLVSFATSMCNKIFAQTDTSFTNLLNKVDLDELFGKDEKKTYFKIQTSYLSNYVYAGRTNNSTTYPYVTPSIEYNHKSGIYASASLSFITKLANDTFLLDVTSIEAGYSFDITKKLSASAYLNKSFYASNTSNILSSSTWATGLSATYDAKYANIGSAIYVGIGSVGSFTLNLSADHSFYLGADSSKYLITITPTINTVFANTKYYQTRKTLPRRVNTSKNKFQLMCYELSLPTYYDKKNWGVFVTPTYAIATNPIITTTQGSLPASNTIEFTETLSNNFFVEIGFYYKF